MTESPRGVCVWLTGRSGAGKTTVTAALVPMLEATGRTVTVLDTVPLLAKVPGERTSEGKLLRKAFVASEIARHGGITVCVTVSARREVRERAREIVGPENFIEVLFDISADEARQRRLRRGSRRSLRKRIKGLARQLGRPVVGRLRGQYQPPAVPDVTIDALTQSPEQGALAILSVLESRGFVTPLDR